MKLIILFEENEAISSYQMEMIASWESQLGYGQLMVFNPPKSGLKNSRYDELKYQTIHKLQYLIRHERKEG